MMSLVSFLLTKSTVSHPSAVMPKTVENMVLDPRVNILKMNPQIKPGILGSSHCSALNREVKPGYQFERKRK